MNETMVLRQIDALAQDLLELATGMSGSIKDSKKVDVGNRKRAEYGTALVGQMKPLYREKLRFISSRLFGVLEYMDKTNTW